MPKDPEYHRKYYLKNRVKLLLMGAAYRAANSERIVKIQAAFYQKNKAALIKRTREYEKRNWDTIKVKRRGYHTRYKRRKYALNFNFRFSVKLRNSIRKRLAGNRKSAATLELVGCTVRELKAYLEHQFKPGMTWENRGSVWHIDHKRPCASFDFSDPAQQRACFNFKNLQPLWAVDNLRKGSKYEKN